MGIGYFSVRFRDAIALKWRSTKPPNVGIDSAMTSFMDQKVAFLAEEKGLSDILEPIYGIEIVNGAWADVSVGQADGANLVCCDSGWGDGVFPCYWGCDADGDVCHLTIDFLVAPLEVPRTRRKWFGLW
jgi:hypothetical protein